MKKEKIVKIIQIIATAIVSIATTLLIESCNLAVAVQKDNNNSNQKSKQSTSVDSIKIINNLKK